MGSGGDAVSVDFRQVVRGSYVRDLVERAANTVWQAALGGAASAVVAVKDPADLRVLGAAALAGAVGGVGSLVKGWAARYRGYRDSASLSRDI